MMIVGQYGWDSDGRFDLIDLDEDDDVDENNDKDDANNDSQDDDNDNVEVAVHASSEIDAADEDKGDEKRKADDGHFCGRNPHWEDGPFEEHARNVLDAHVDAEARMSPLTPLDVDDAVVTVGDDQLLVVQGVVVPEDEDEELCVEERFCDMMQVQNAVMQVQ